MKQPKKLYVRLGYFLIIMIIILWLIISLNSKINDLEERIEKRIDYLINRLGNQQVRINRIQMQVNETEWKEYFYRCLDINGLWRENEGKC